MGLDTYLANVVVGDEGTPGAPVLHVSALVVVPSGLISGHAEITQAVAAPNDDLKISDLRGRIREIHLGGEQFRVVTLSGTYTVSFPPPAIGELEQKFDAALVLQAEGTWDGVGSFTYGNKHVDDVPVKAAIHMGAAQAAAAN